ncbi:MAG TPA: alkaline phosphatase family protein [Rhizomicrobium sp.]|nr:alkaline phosphatase family protein [Rhizomicrobium sp.]
MKLSRTLSALLGATVLSLTAGSCALAKGVVNPDSIRTATPIKHLVVIYQENVSFDHYFGTYPYAANPPGEPPFKARKDTPTDINTTENAGLLTNNPNYLNPMNGDGAANPFRLDLTQVATADQNHNYTPEQQAEDNGAADLFPYYTGAGTPGGQGAFGTTGQVMGYYDGNTVTAMWSYAQNFAMSDSARTDGYGPSTPGALEAVSGQLNGMQIGVDTNGKTSFYVADGQGGYTLMGDVDPANDICSSTTDTAYMSGRNIGDLLNDAGIAWGGFMGGFNLSLTNPNGTTGCARSTTSTYTGVTENDYIQHHNWFQYYSSTANPTHARPSSIAAIGYTDQANHEYDIDDFYAAVSAGNFPAVSYIKAPAYEDGHAGYSDPADEQYFLVTVINFLEQQPDWKNTAVVVTYDDSDGWYDHAYAAPISSSYTSADQLNGNGICGSGTQPDGLNGLPVNGRCGQGLRIPFMVISKHAKKNYVSHVAISQASIVQFIEDNWLVGERLGGGSFDNTTGSITDMFDFSAGKKKENKVILDPKTGLQTASANQ